MMLCLLGDSQDYASVYMGWLAARRDVRVLELNESSLGDTWDYDIDSSGEGVLRVGAERMPWSAIDGIFVRLKPEPELPGRLTLGPTAQMVFVQERREGLHQLLEATRSVVVNRPSSGRSNASKPFQMQELSEAGFDVPRWICTNSHEAVRSFASECSGDAIYKATSGLRSRVRKVDDEFFGRLQDGTTPAVVQEYVSGRDVRVHTVGSQAFACEIVGGGVDYRFEHERAIYRATDIDADLAARCCAHAARHGLLLAGFDFRVSADERWRCLEMNPVPSFIPYEMSSGLPIGEAVLDLLVYAKRQ